MVQGPPPMCMECARHYGDLTCEAFPEGIPDPIVMNQHDHREAFKGDKDLLFLQDQSIRGASGSPFLEEV